MLRDRQIGRQAVLTISYSFLFSGQITTGRLYDFFVVFMYTIGRSLFLHVSVSSVNGALPDLSMYD